MLTMTIWLIPVLFFVLFAVRQRGQASREVDSVENAIEIHKARLVTLAQQFEANELSEEEYKSFKAEEEKALLADTEFVKNKDQQATQMNWWWVPALTVVAMASTFVIYQKVGALDAVEVRDQFRELQLMSEMDEELIATTLKNYQELLKKDPGDIEGWFQLSQMQMDMNLYDQALISLQHVLAEIRKVDHNAEDESSLLIYIGQAYMYLQQSEPALAAFEESLQYAQSPTALGLAGRMTMALGQYEQAIDYWTRLKLANPHADTTVIDQLIDQSVAALAEQGIDYAVEQPTRIIVSVSLPKAYEGLSDSAALFIYARPVGQRMPLAVKRLPINSQNMTVLLTDADAMGPMGGISTQEVVEVTARVSLTGIANTQPGDWQANVEQVTIDGKEMTANLVITQP